MMDINNLGYTNLNTAQNTNSTKSQETATSVNNETTKPLSAVLQTLTEDTVEISSEAFKMFSASEATDEGASTQSAGGTTLPGWPPKKAG
jgi:hypothetical protein